MAWRKWLVRGIVFLVVVGLAGAGLLYQRWTNPEAVRRQVIDQLGAHLVGADITLQSAHVRLLGGISFSDLSLRRADGSEGAEFAHIPDGIVYPDKEQAINGRFAIRKIELHRPRFRVRRGPDGRWNLQGVLAPPNLDEPFPTMVIEQGTVVVEDDPAAAGQPPLEITGVNLTLVNDPLPVIHFQGNGACSLAGGVRLQGAFQRASGDTSVSFQAADIPVGQPLMQRLGVYAPDLVRDAPEVSGVGSLQGDLGYAPGAAQPWTHNVRFELADGRLRHPKIPLDLEKVQAALQCLDGRLNLESFTAHSGPAEVMLTGRVESLHPDANFQGTLTVKHLALTPQVFEQLPEELRKVRADYSPEGAVTLTYEAARTAGQWVKHCTVQLEDLTASFVKFPYTLEHATGTIKLDSDTARHHEEIRLDLVGKAAGQVVHVRGTIRGESPLAQVAVKVWGDDIPLDDKLMAALAPHPDMQALARTFHPTGRVNFEAHVTRARGRHDFANRYVLKFHDATACYDVFPLPLEGVSGVLDVLPDHWEFYDFRGTHAGGEIFTAGRFDPGPKGHLGRLVIEIKGRMVPLDAELKAAFKDPDLTQARQAWDVLHPEGRMNFSARVNRQGDTPPEVEVGLTAVGCSVKPDFFKYLLEDLSGTFYYARHWVSFENFQARHGKSVLRADKGQVYLKPEGGAWAQLTNLQGTPLVPDDDLMQALPEVVRNACDALQLRDPLTLDKTSLTVATTAAKDAPPDIYWDGTLIFRDAALKTGVPWEGVTGRASCRGRFNGRELEGMVGNLSFERATLYDQPFGDIQASFEVKKEAPNILVIPGLLARVYGGEVYGPVRVEFGPRPRYEVNLIASQVKLEEFGRRNLGPDAPVSGLATARLHLQGNGPDLSDLTGRGSIDVENGRMYNLPLLLDLLKFLSLRPPDGTAFEEAHAAFAVRGPRVAISRLDLFGNSVSLRGQGEMNLDGTDINLDFFAVWARVIQLLPPIIKEIPQDLSKYLLKIKMRGRINDVHFTKEPVPVLVEPIKGLLERMVKPRRGDGESRPSFLAPFRSSPNEAAAGSTGSK